MLSINYPVINLQWAVGGGFGGGGRKGGATALLIVILDYLNNFIFSSKLVSGIIKMCPNYVSVSKREKAWVEMS